MPDFMIVIDSEAADLDAIGQALRDRPGMSQLLTEACQFPWGAVVVQNTRGFGYEPCRERGRVSFSVGRPRIMGYRHEDAGPTGFTSRITDLAVADDPQQSYRNLTGMFVLVSCSDTGFTCFTDHLGVYPVYRAEAKYSRRVVFGTQPELVARYAGRGDDFDSASLGEILIRDAITFPYTTRRGMTELEPGSRYRFTVSDKSVHEEHESLWVPREPDRWPSLATSREQLEAALRFAGEDITRGSQRIGVTLSGGTDSRTVLASVPPEKRALAITYADHMNEEVKTAAQIAQVAGVDQHLAMRSPDFYAHLCDRETALLGAERGLVNAHGFALHDTPPQEGYDLLLCGHLSDTLLKGSSAPGLGVRRRAQAFRRNGIAGLWTPLPPLFFASDVRQRIAEHLTDETWRAVQDRVLERYAALRELRPRTWQEWFGLYPLSRRASISYTLANARLFPSDQLFLHARIIEVARTANPIWKKLGLLATPVFSRVGGALADVTNNNTGLSASASPLRLTLVKTKQRYLERKQTPAKWIDREHPWYTSGSWIDYRLMQIECETWKALREEAHAARPSVFADVISSPRDLLSGYHDDLGAAANYTIVKMARTWGIRAVDKIRPH